MSIRQAIVRSTGVLSVALVLLPSAPADAGGVGILLRNPSPGSGDLPATELAEMLGTSLQQDWRVPVVDRAGVLEAADALGIDLRLRPAPEQVARLGKAVGSEVLILGTAEAAGIRIDARIVDVATESVLGTQSVPGSRDDVFDIIDILSQRLAQGIRAADHDRSIVAVLSFQNCASPASELFVAGIPEMVMTGLRQATGLSLVDRSLVVGEMQRRHLMPAEGVSAEEAAAQGRQLGADIVIVGSFADLVEISADAVIARTDKSIGQINAAGASDQVPTLISQVSADLHRHLRRYTRTTRAVAVLYFQNHSEGHFDSFVRGISDMLMTSLGQADRLTIIERVQIESAMRNFNLEMAGPIDSETAVEVGAWLGADAVVLGSFLRFGAIYRIDARLIDAETGELMIAESVRGPEADVIAMVDSLGAKLVESFGQQEAAVDIGTGSLQVVFRMVKSEMGERPLYHHICKLYVDGKYMGLSDVVEERDRWVGLFERTLRAGRHRVEIVHGYVLQGSWDGPMPLQPDTFSIDIEPETSSTIKYGFEVGWFDDRYVLEPSWLASPGQASR